MGDAGSEPYKGRNMKNLTALFACISALILLACSGNVSIEQKNDEGKFDLPQSEPQSQPYRCDDWTRDEGFAQIEINGTVMSAANGSNLMSNLLISISAGQKQAIARRDGNGWAVTVLPPTVYQSQKLCTLPNGTTYLAAMDTTGKAMLLKGEGASWTSENVLDGVAQIVNVWHANGSVLLMGLTSNGAMLVLSNESGSWQENSLPDLSIPYFLYRFWSVRSDYFAFGFFDFEKGAKQHAVLLHRHAGESTWQNVALPNEVYLIGEMFGYETDSLYFAGQSNNKTAVVYKATNNMGTWETYATKTDLYAYTNVWVHGNGTLIAAGQSESQNNANGFFVQLDGADFYEDSSMYRMIDDSAGYPYESWYDVSTKNLYLLTSDDLYYRHCP